MRISTLLLCLCVSVSSVAQTTIKWADLEDVDFVEFYDRERSEWSLKAEFSEEILALDNQEVIITGYVIPLDVSGEVYVLSAFAFSSCFFCGGAGPETVMGLTFTDTPPQLKTDDVISVRGTLQVNVNPGLEFHYMLTDVVITKLF
ncbi:DUF3299 domain-containing protein [Phaeocystidibacter luteus]|uniref:DUF3299 domain-containing protein n=1 Tax=Phaeocystidibacter luteus TaxID=911197 RepID=UPI001672AED4|nr:DUF3299 domain-containing protein [Phaeocystidibacter luteus]